MAIGWAIMLLETFLGSAFETLLVSKHTMNASDNVNIIAEQLQPSEVYVFSIGNRIFQQENVRYHKGWIVLEWLKGQKINYS